MGFHVEARSGWRYKPVLWSVIFLIIAFIAWAGLFDVEQHVRAQGRIIPAGQAKVVQHLEGGIVSAILVEEGQRVEKGDILLQVRNQGARSDLEEQKISLEALRVKLTRLQAEHRDSDDFEPPSVEPTPRIQETIDSEKRLFVSRRQALKEKISVLDEQVKQKQLKLEDLIEQLKNIDSERGVAQDQLEINERLRKSGAVSESRYLDAKSRVKSFDTRMAQVQKNIPITQAEIQEIKQKIGSEKESYATDIIDEMNQVELGIQKLRERLKARTDEVDRTDVISPATGIVNTLHINTVGGVVRPGDPLVEIIPLEDNLIVEGRVLTKDRGLIWVGLPVVIKVTAYDYAVYGGIDGHIKDISADSFVDKQGVQYYRIRVDLNRNVIGKGAGKPLYPGMTVEANIISGKTTVLHALLKPLWRVQQNAIREP